MTVEESSPLVCLLNGVAAPLLMAADFKSVSCINLLSYLLTQKIFWYFNGFHEMVYMCEMFACNLSKLHLEENISEGWASTPALLRDVLAGEDSSNALETTKGLIEKLGNNFLNVCVVSPPSRSLDFKLKASPMLLTADSLRMSSSWVGFDLSWK